VSAFKKGDHVTHLKKAHRGVAVISHLVDGMATLKYPQYKLTVIARVRDLKKEN